MKTISIINQKGGCGKTTISVNLAAGLSKKGWRVLILDLDPQGHASYSLREELPSGVNAFGPTITDIMEKMLTGSSLGENFFTPLSENLYLLPSSVGLASLEHKLLKEEEKLKYLKMLLDENSSFDFCIIDCPPSLSMLTLNAIYAADYILTPLNLCDYSLRGIEILKEVILMLKENTEVWPTIFYIFNMVDKRSSFCRVFLYKMKEKLNTFLLNTFIRNNITLREAASKGKHIFDYRASSRGGEDFAKLTLEIEQKMKKTSWRSLFLKGRDLEEVYAVGDFNNWQKQPNYKLKKITETIWGLNISLSTGTYHYKFLSKNNWFADPLNKLTVDDNFGGKNSLLQVE